MYFVLRNDKEIKLKKIQYTTALYKMYLKFKNLYFMILSWKEQKYYFIYNRSKNEI